MRGAPNPFATKVTKPSNEAFVPRKRSLSAIGLPSDDGRASKKGLSPRVAINPFSSKLLVAKVRESEKAADP